MPGPFALAHRSDGSHRPSPDTSMRTRKARPSRSWGCVTALAGLLLVAVLPASAQTASDREAADSVPVCDSLIGLRQLSAAAGEDRSRAVAQIAAHPGCRLVPRNQIGAVERRTMFGGGAYECVALGTGACAWVMP